MSDDRLIIFDTTLRDGEQSPGASMNLPEKLEVAHALRELGVDVIEAGFPIASPGDFEAVQAIARQVRRPGHLRPGPLQRRRHRSGLGGSSRTPTGRASTSSWPPAPSTASSSCSMAKDEIVRRAVEGVERAKSYCDDIEFSPEDAARTELDFLAEVVEKAIDAGATTVNIPDTVGYAVPEQYADAIRYPQEERAAASTRSCSASIATTIWAWPSPTAWPRAQGGRRQVECTINGLGERAGNCALEEDRHGRARPAQDYFWPQHAASTRRRLCPTSRLVSHITGIQVQRNKAIVGQNAFAHEAGIHQDGMLKHRSDLRNHEPRGRRPAADRTGARQAYRPACPARSASATWAITSTTTQLQKVFDGFKALADRKKTIYDADIEALAEADAARRAGVLDARSGHLQRRLRHRSLARPSSSGTRTARIDRDASTGDGPIDAVFKTIERITGIEPKLRDYSVNSVTVGEDAQGEAHVEAEYNGRNLRGRAVSTDIIEASALAFLQVINRIASRKAAEDRVVRPTEAVERSAARGGGVRGPMGADDGFLRAIAEDPQDLATHLVYADWLEENGQERVSDCLRTWCQLVAIPYSEDNYKLLAVWVERYRSHLYATPHPGWVHRLAKVRDWVDASLAEKVARLHLRIRHGRKEDRQWIEPPHDASAFGGYVWHVQYWRNPPSRRRIGGSLLLQAYWEQNCLEVDRITSEISEKG